MVNSKVVSCIAVLIISLVVAGPRANAESAITCEQVTIWLTPCIGYGVVGGKVPEACCSGLKALDAAAKTTEDRRTKCNCIKEGAAKVPGLNYERVNTLPGICGTSSPSSSDPPLTGICER